MSKKPFKTKYLKKFPLLVIATLLIISLDASAATKKTATTPKPAPAPVQTPASQLTATDFVLTWLANTYVPPNYSGKALPTYDSFVKVYVLPTTKAGLNPAPLIYRWYLDDQFDDFASGENRQVFTFQTTKIAGGQHFVEVKILDKDEQELFALSTAVPVVLPQIALCLVDKNTTNFSLIKPDENLLSPGQEGTFVALPYFFNISSPFDLTFQWSFDGQTISKTEEKNKFSIKAAAGDLAESFTKNLAVLAVNPTDEIQRATGNIEITIKK